MAILNLIAAVTISARCIADCPTVLVNPVPECDPDQGEICLTPAYPFALSPSGGMYSTSQVVFVAINEPGLIVRYRMDDQEPSDTDPIFEPLQPLIIDRPTTITAKACSAFLGGGLVQSTRYEFAVSDVVVDPPPGGVELGTSVSLRGSPDKSIFISFAPPPATLDTISDWVPYQSPINVTSNTTFHFKATKPDYQPMLRTVSYTVARLPRPMFKETLI